MKKRLLTLIALSLLISLCLMSFVSCGDEVPDPATTPGEGADGSTVDPCAKGHSYDAFNKCEVCGAIYEDDELYFWSLNHGTEYAVSGVNDDLLTEITIPAKYKGQPVTIILETAFSDCTNLKKLIIPDSIKKIERFAFENCPNLIQVENGVSYVDRWVIDCNTSVTSAPLRTDTVGIADWAFEDCNNLASISFPNTVKSIGNDAFYDCSSLTDISIPSSVTNLYIEAFAYCDNLNSIAVEAGNPIYYSTDNCIIERATGTLVVGCKNSVIPTDGRVTAIGESAFIGCKDLTSINIPSSVKHIGDYAFQSCSSLSDINIPNSVTSIGYATFWHCSGLTDIEIPDHVTKIGPYAFYNCINLENVNIPTHLTEISSSSFEGCTKVLQIENKVSYIGKWAVDCKSTATSAVLRNDTIGIADYTFFFCGDEFTSVTIPYGVKYIGEAAFDGCSGLKSIKIPRSVKSIGKKAFNGCSNLISIDIPDSVTKIEWLTFSGCTSLREINIPSSVTSIGGYAFYQCYSLKGIQIPNSVTSIEANAFASCTNLTGINLPDSVTSISENMFFGCEKLTMIKIGSNVTNIGDNAFYTCSYLRSITFRGTVAQWNSISKGTDWNYRVPATEVICSDGSVSLN